NTRRGPGFRRNAACESRIPVRCRRRECDGTWKYTSFRWNDGFRVTKAAPHGCATGPPRASRETAVTQFQKWRRVGEPLPVIPGADGVRPKMAAGAKPWLPGELPVLQTGVENGIRTRNTQLGRLLLYH